MWQWMSSRFVMHPVCKSLNTCRHYCWILLLTMQGACVQLGLDAKAASLASFRVPDHLVWSSNIPATHKLVDAVQIAAEDGHVHNSAAIKALADSDEALLEWISSKQYIPRYQSVVKLPTGVME